MTITLNHFGLEFFGVDSFFIRAFGYEVFKQPGEKMIISRSL